MQRILFFIIALLVALVGVNVYFMGTAKADEISRYLQGASKAQQWADYIYQNQSGRNRISRLTAGRIAKAVLIASSNYDIAPDVIVGLMKTESGFDPKARSRSGALGLMQVVPYWHKKMIAGRDLFHIKAAVGIGVAILAEYQRRSKGSLTGALRRYCGYHPKAADIYVAEVMREHRRAFQSLMVASAAAIPVAPAVHATALMVEENTVMPEKDQLIAPAATPIEPAVHATALMVEAVTVMPEKDPLIAPAAAPVAPAVHATALMVDENTVMPEKDPLIVSTAVELRLTRISAFGTFGTLAGPEHLAAKDSFLAQAKVYLKDTLVALHILPEKLPEKPRGFVPPGHLLDFGDLTHPQRC